MYFTETGLVSKCLWSSSLAEKPDHQVSCRFNFHGGRSNMSQKGLMGGRDLHNDLTLFVLSTQWLPS